MDFTEREIVVMNRYESSLLLEEKGKQDQDPILPKLLAFEQKVLSFEQCGDGVLRYLVRSCVPMVDGLQQKIMEEWDLPLI